MDGDAYAASTPKFEQARSDCGDALVSIFMGAIYRRSGNVPATESRTLPTGVHRAGDHPGIGGTGSN
ncbi:hypothetical protein AB5J56_38855 [Streptomyces sp. R21]|uniref:Uncharacterized protein n=1 Tax=Streptomyces sp. R21 TaxID=3238627 RepID=A0AB39PHV4_9ACTN